MTQEQLDLLLHELRVDIREVGLENVTGEEAIDYDENHNPLEYRLTLSWKIEEEE